MTRNERIASAVILACLVCIALAVAAYRLDSEGSPTALSTLLPRGAPPGWHRRLVEEYPSYRLNEKINGQDIEFLSRDCSGLAWCAFADTEREGLSLSIFIYDMSKQQNALSIYQAIRGPPGPDLTALEIGDDAYTIAGSIFFCSGRYYVQLLASNDAPQIDAACRLLVREILENIRASKR